MEAKDAMSAKTKKLFDLYVTGTTYTITDGSIEETVWLQKLNQHEAEIAYRKANAKRAAYMISKKYDEQNENTLAVRGEYDLLFESRETMIDYLGNEAVGRAYEAKEAELAATDEWSKDGLYQGMLDAWRDEMGERYARDPEDPEAKALFEEMKRFTEQLEGVLQDVKDEETAHMERWDDQKIEDALLDKLMLTEADSVWLGEYKMWELYFAVREADNHANRYFDDREQLNLLSLDVQVGLMQAYMALTVDIIEGKD